MKKRIMCAMMCVAMVATLLAGCGSKADKGTTDNSAAEATDHAAGAGTTDHTGETGKVYYLNFKPEQGKDWEALAATYTEETGVPVTVVTAASGEYETTLKSEMAKSNAPTLFQVNGPVGLASWKDYCYDLKDSEIYKQVKNDDFVLKDGDAVNGIAYVIESYGIIYNKTLLDEYCHTEGAVISSADEINSFDKLKAVADDIQTKKDELGIMGAFACAGMDASSDWRFTTHLANLPIYYEYKDKGIGSTEAIEGTYLDNYQKIWDLYITDSTCAPTLLSSKTGEDAVAEFASGDVVFYQNGTWAYNDCIADGLTDEELGMLPIYIGAPGEENQGLCTGSENYWCVNKKASEADIQATLDFLNWCITSDTGRDALTNTMGFLTPFKSFDEGYVPANPLVAAANEYIAAGKTAVSWNFASIPSLNWKNHVGSALTQYAEGKISWDDVKKVFITDWATEYALANQQ